MADFTESQPGIVVCGADAGSRLETFARTLDRPLPIYQRHTPEILIDALKAWQHPLCILEHHIGIIDFNAPDPLAVAMPRLFAERIVVAHQLIPFLVRISPGTRYIVTSHTRGTGVGSEREIYKRIPQVSRVIGFLNSGTASKYLLKYVEQRWGARYKPQEQYEREFEARQEQNRLMCEELRRRREQRDESNNA